MQKMPDFAVTSRLLAGASLALLTASALAASAPDRSESLGEIVVTASKRQERLQDTAEAISVVNAAKLENLGVVSFQDYASLVPNLNQALSAGVGTGTIILRGLYSGGEQTTNTTAVYLGETPFTPNGGFAIGSFLTPDPDLVDVERIEVLKGPQGTIWGASALGGLIRIIPKEPDPSHEGVSGTVQLGGSVVEGGDLGYTARGSVYATLVPDRLAVGLSAFGRRDPGFVTNVQTGTDIIGQADSRGVSGSVVVKPTDELTLKGRILLQSADQIGLIGQDNVTGTGTPLYGERKQSYAFDQGEQTRYELYELVGDYKTDFGTLTATASRTRNKLTEQVDYTKTYGLYSQLYSDIFSNPPYNFAPPLPAGFQVYSPVRPFTVSNNAEVRFASSRLGQFEFLLGAYYTDQHSDYIIDLLNRTSDGIFIPGFLGNLGTTETFNSYREFSYYGNITFYFTDDLDVTGGVRQAKDWQGGEVTGNGLLFIGVPTVTPLASRDESTQFQVTLRWRPDQDLSTYFRAASGYRPGGPQNNPFSPIKSYQPDQVYDYEIGAKGRALDGRLSFDAAAYYIDWENIQLNGLLGGFLLVGNAGAAEIKGVELETSYAVTPQIKLGLAFGYNDASITDVGVTTAEAIGARVGDRLPGSPQVTIAATADYDFPITDAIGGAVGLTVRYQGDKISSYSAAVLDVPYREPAYATLDLRAQANWSNYTVRLGISNLLDENGYTGYFTSQAVEHQGTPSTAYLTRPRTFSVSLTADF